MKKKLCPVKYWGPSVPSAHGTRCTLEAGHDKGPPHGTARHVSRHDGHYLSWYTPEQKAARAEET